MIAKTVAKQVTIRHLWEVEAYEVHKLILISVCSIVLYQELLEEEVTAD